MGLILAIIVTLRVAGLVFTAIAMAVGFMALFVILVIAAIVGYGNHRTVGISVRSNEPTIGRLVVEFPVRRR